MRYQRHQVAPHRPGCAKASCHARPVSAGKPAGAADARDRARDHARCFGRPDRLDLRQGARHRQKKALTRSSAPARERSSPASAKRPSSWSIVISRRSGVMRSARRRTSRHRSTARSNLMKKDQRRTGCRRGSHEGPAIRRPQPTRRTRPRPKRRACPNPRAHL